MKFRLNGMESATEFMHSRLQTMPVPAVMNTPIQITLSLEMELLLLGSVMVQRRQETGKFLQHLLGHLMQVLPMDAVLLIFHLALFRLKQNLQTGLSQLSMIQLGAKQQHTQRLRLDGEEAQIGC